MSTMYVARLALEENEVKALVKEAGLSIHLPEDKNSPWEWAITDGENYIWPEVGDMSMTYIFLRWGRNEADSIFDKLNKTYSALVKKEYGVDDANTFFIDEHAGKEFHKFLYQHKLNIRRMAKKGITA